MPKSIFKSRNTGQCEIEQADFASGAFLGAAINALVPAAAPRSGLQDSVTLPFAGNLAEI